MALENLAASARLMQMDALIDKKARTVDLSYNDMAPLTEDYQMGAQAQVPIMQQEVPVIKGGSKLPREIIESFSKVPPMEGKDPTTSSVLDSIGMTQDQINKIRGNMTSSRQATDQQKIQPRPQIIEQKTVGVDYSLIKSIIDESVKKYVGAYTKKILTEQKSSNLHQEELGFMQIGESFKFVTKTGDIYEAKLTYKGNINKK